jgi:glutathione S-transferase
MQLIGYLDSPFVRRVAVSMHFLGIDFEHRELSIFRDYDEFRTINPAVKVPTLVCDNGEVLMDSQLILTYLESVSGKSLMPVTTEELQPALQMIGFALISMEKVAQIIYETSQRPQEKQHGPWIQRVDEQLAGAVELMEAAIEASAGSETSWLFGDSPGQADISMAVAFRFTQHIDRARIAPADYPALAAFSEKAERLEAFKACPLSG